jgi:uncharacterized protein YprB with RNaseH-like and TPR domain
MAEESLEDKLKALGVKLGSQGVPRPPPPRALPIESVIPGELIQTAFGETFRILANYPPDYRHGNGDLNLTAPLKRMAEWGHADHLADDPRASFFFLDTETSGLAGGAGTFAFLVGIGRYTQEGFELAQFFMRDPAEEPALLAAVSAYLSGCRALVTFNGKAFDAPLLNARYTLQGMTSPLAGMVHFDLLPLARRLWRERLPSRTLGYLENAILGHTRTQEEVPGWLIPEMYFEYLRSRDARPLAGVFYHNATDVLSMAALFRYIVRLLADPLTEPFLDTLDRISLGRLFEELGYDEIAAQLYRSSLEQGLPESHRWITLERLSLLCKRRGEWEAALSLWQEAAAGGQVFACVELAKYFEHRRHEYAEAARWSEAGLAIVAASNFPAYLRNQWNSELTHRLQRLRKLMGRSG